MSFKGKLLFVSESSGFAGGVERYLFHTAKLLRANGFTVDGTFENPARGKEAFEAAFDRVLPWGAVDDLPDGYDFVMVHKLRSASRLEALERRFKVVVMVHDHEYFCPRFCKYFPFTRKNCHRHYRRWFCGVCGMLRGLEGGNPFTLAKYRVFEFPRLAKAVLAADKLAVLSQFMAGELESNGVDPDKIVLIPPWVPAADPALPDAGEPPHIVCSGQMIRGKGFDLLLEALGKLDGEWTADLLGDGKDRAMLEDMAGGLGGRVKFHGWVSDPEKYYHAATLAVLPWRWQEPFGLVGPEALAYALPLAGFAVGGFGEYLKDGVTGIAAAPGNADALAFALRELLADPQKARRFGANGRKLVEERFSAEKLVENYRELAAETAASPLRVSVFSVNIETGTMGDALDEVAAAVDGKGGRPGFCAFVNADCLNQAWNNHDYAELLRRADHVWADGSGVAIAARRQRRPVRGNVNGTDMLPELCRAGYRLYLFGGAPGVAERARQRLEAEFKQVRIVGVEHGFVTDHAAAVERINAAAPDILLVAMGVPRQEFWISRHLDVLNCKVAMGVGGLFDFASGRIRRAPLWLRRIGMEWSYRLYNEPVRLFRRYVIGNPVFLCRIWFAPHHRAKKKEV